MALQNYRSSHTALNRSQIKEEGFAFKSLNCQYLSQFIKFGIQLNKNWCFHKFITKSKLVFNFISTSG